MKLDHCNRASCVQIMTNLNALESLAKAATQGPWDMVENSHLSFGGVQLHWINSEAGNLAENICEEEAAYITAANPEAILALIALVRQQHEALKEVSMRQARWTDMQIAALDAYEEMTK